MRTSNSIPATNNNTHPDAPVNRRRRGWLYGPATAALMACYGGAAFAEEVYLDFDRGIVGRADVTKQSAEAVKTFDTLSTIVLSMAQDTDNGRFGGSGGNDTSAEILIVQYDGTEIVIPGNITWYDGDNPLHGVGFVPSSATVYQIAYPGSNGTEYYQIDGGSSYLFQLNSSGKSYVDGQTYSGINPNSGMFDQLNAQVVAESGGFEVSKSSVAVSESGTTDTFDVHLTSPPRSNVVLTVTVSDATEATVDKVDLTFTPQNRDIPQRVTVTGQDDTASDGDVSSTIRLAVNDAASDNDYDAVSNQTVFVTTTDDEGGSGGGSDTDAPFIEGPSGQPGDAISTTTINENQNSAAGFTANEPVTWSISGGEDASAFNINASSGALSFIIAPDYESPEDGPSAGANTYIVEVTATDASDNASSQTLTVTVQNVDDDSPIIQGPSGQPGDLTAAASTAENQTEAATFSANETVTWSIAGGEDQDAFNIDSGSGALSFRTAPDYENPTDGPSSGANTYIVQIAARDMQNNVSSQLVTINVTDQDENGPIITGPSGGLGAPTSAVSVAENQTSAASFTSSKAATWSITDGEDQIHFDIDSTTGTLTFRSAPDFEAPTDGNTDGSNTYIVEVTARDAQGFSSAQTVTITVTDQDETAPVITGPTGAAGDATATTSIDEGIDTVGLYTADEPATFAVTGGEDAAQFVFENDVLKFVATPDYEAPRDGTSSGLNTYHVEVTATDADNNSSMQMLTVRINDLDDSAPLISGPSGNAGDNSSATSTDEGEQNVFTFTANEAVTWSITSGEDQSAFSIDPSTGALSFTAAPDYESPTDGPASGSNTYVVEVTATDSAGNASNQTVTVSVTDIDDTAPVISGPNSAAGSNIDQVDVNEGQTSVWTYAANETVTWSLTGGEDMSFFAIDPNTGTLSFSAAPDFGNPSDGSTGGPNTYIVEVTATDSASYESRQLLTVTVQDVDQDAPRITGMSGGAGDASSGTTAPEGQTSIGTFQADEPVTWSLSGGEDVEAFQIDAQTGAFSFRSAPDFEAPTDGPSKGQNTYVVQVTAEDASGLISVQEVTITVLNVDDEAPIIQGPSGQPGDAQSTTSVSEGQTAITTLTANEAVDWSTVGGEDLAQFSINPSTGELFFNTAPDYEQPADGPTDGSNTYRVTVEARDPYNYVSTQDILVTVTDIDDTAPMIEGPSGQPGDAISTAEVIEGQTVVATLQANEPVSWSISGGEDSARLTVDPTSGVLRFRTAPDYEQPTDGTQEGSNTYIVEVTATDGENNLSSQMITISVTDRDENAPLITGPDGVEGNAHSSTSIEEGQTEVATYTANESVTWSIIGGEDAAYFQIDGTTGALSFTTSPDFEQPTDGPEAGANTYVVVVSSEDADGNSSSQSLTVTITDVDEDAPLITGPDGIEGSAQSATSIAEGQTGVGTYTANEPVTWSIAGGEDAASFQIDGNTGALTFVTAPDYEQPTDGPEAGSNTYVVVVASEDADGLSSSQTLTVTVTDVNEDAPVIEGPGDQPIGDRYESEVPEGSLHAADFGSNEDVVWEISGGEDAALFEIDEHTGVLSFVNAPDFEAPQDGATEGTNTYLVDVSATDAEDNTTIQPVMIRITDVEEAAPSIRSPNGDQGAEESQLTIDEGIDTVGVFTADGPVTWSISGGEDAYYFTIDQDSGELQFTTTPDYDFPRDGPQDGLNTYIVGVRATATGGSFATQQVTVRVQQVESEQTRALFEEDREQIEAIIRGSAKGALHNTLSGHRNMTTAARHRFAEAKEIYAGCHGGQEATSFGEGCTGFVGRNHVPFDVTGFAELTGSGFRSSGEFYEQTGNFEGSQRRIFSGDYSVVSQGGVKTLSLNARVAHEYTVASDLMWGFFAAGSISDSQIGQSDYSGTGDALSLSLGGYVVRELSEDLFFDGFAALGGGHNNLDIASDDLTLEGTYRSLSAQLGGSISGAIRFNRYEIWPALSFAYGQSAISSVSLDASSADGPAAVEMDVQSVEVGTLSFTPELRRAFGYGDRSHLSIAPQLTCEIVDGEVTCGEGIAIGLKDAHPSGLKTFNMQVESGTIGDLESYRFNISRQIRF